MAMNPADEVRDYAYREYILPARAAGNLSVTFTAGPIHIALGFQNLIARVCDALDVYKFETDRGIQLVTRTGPKHGATATFTFSV
jgi:hypothetical protein